MGMWEYDASTFLLHVKAFWEQVRGTILLLPQTQATHATPLLRHIIQKE